MAKDNGVYGSILFHEQLLCYTAPKKGTILASTIFKDFWTIPKGTILKDFYSSNRKKGQFWTIGKKKRDHHIK